MKILKRTQEIVAANLNDLVDRFEQPEQMLRQGLREMEALIDTTSTAVARSLAAEKLLVSAVEAEREQVDIWHRRAEQAIERGNTPLARQAIARQLERADILKGLERQRQETQATNTQLREELNRLRARHSAAAARLAALNAGQAAADARRAAHGAAQSFGNSHLSARRFDHFCQQLELAHAESAALADLSTPELDSVGEMWEADEREGEIEAELASLQARAERESEL